jgi:hypothetical protein
MWQCPSAWAGLSIEVGNLIKHEFREEILGDLCLLGEVCCSIQQSISIRLEVDDIPGRF